MSRIEIANEDNKKVAFGYDHIVGFFYQRYDYDNELEIDIDSTKGLTYESLMERVEHLLGTLQEEDRNDIINKLRREVN